MLRRNHGDGETDEDRVSLALELRALEVESIPVNFLDPRPGTPLGDTPPLSPHECLRTLAMFRFVNPSRDIRIAGGREVNLRHLQSLALYPANSLFCNGYLTTGGQGYESDRRMIADAGFKVAELVEASAVSQTRMILVTGTDTDVGKTWVTRAPGGALRAAGQRIIAIKPVETG